MTLSGVVVIIRAVPSGTSRQAKDHSRPQDISPMFRNIELRRISAVSIAAIALGLTACNRETADAAPPTGAARLVVVDLPIDHCPATSSGPSGQRSASVIRYRSISVTCGVAPCIRSR